jgi:hypothetical protein
MNTVSAPIQTSSAIIAGSIVAGVGALILVGTVSILCLRKRLLRKKKVEKGATVEVAKVDTEVSERSIA